MITRAQVAKRIGKSIATVRRLEGVVLWPQISDGGVRLFDEHQVERLMEKPSLIARHGRSEWFASKRGSGRQRTRASSPRVLLRGQQKLPDVLVLAEMLEALECASVHDLVRAGIDADLLERFAVVVAELELLRGGALD